VVSLAQTANWFAGLLGYTPNRHIRGARITKQNKNWQPPGVSGDGALSEAPELLLARIREQAVNSPLIKRAGELISQMTVGQGIGCYSDPAEFMYANRDDDRLLEWLDRYSEESDWRFEKWGEKFADVEGRATWGELQYQHFHESMTVGDSFLVESNLPLTGGRKVPTAFQLLEKEQLDRNKDRSASDGLNAIVNGIELNSRGQAIAYHFLDAHPFDPTTGGSYKSQRIPAERVNHLFRKHRPSAHSGLTAHHANIADAKDFDRFFSARIQQQIVSAYITGILHNLKNSRMAGLSGADNSDEGEIDADEVRLGVGNILTFNNEIKIGELKGPNASDSTEFGKFILLLQSMGIGISYARLTGDTASINFSAGLLAQANDHAFVKPLQDFYVARTLRPVREKIDRWHATLDVFNSVTAREWFRDQEYLTEYSAIGPGKAELKPLEEEEASNARIRGGRGTLDQENAIRNRYWRKVLRQRKKEMRYEKRCGLTLDFTKGNGGNAADNASKTEAAT
jgi:lambda family phage portal protein